MEQGGGSEVAGGEGEGLLPVGATRDQASPKYPVNGTNGTGQAGQIITGRRGMFSRAAWPRQAGGKSQTFGSVAYGRTYNYIRGCGWDGCFR